MPKAMGSHSGDYIMVLHIRHYLAEAEKNYSLLTLKKQAATLRKESMKRIMWQWTAGPLEIKSRGPWLTDTKKTGISALQFQGPEFS